jgi:hypothetical protein
MPIMEKGPMVSFSARTEKKRGRKIHHEHKYNRCGSVPSFPSQPQYQNAGGKSGKVRGQLLTQTEPKGDIQARVSKETHNQPYEDVHQAYAVLQIGWISRQDPKFHGRAD